MNLLVKSIHVVERVRSPTPRKFIDVSPPLKDHWFNGMAGTDYM